MNKRALKYVCPICGRKGVFGQHICPKAASRDPYADLRPGAGTPEGDLADRKRLERRNRRIVLVASIFLCVAAISFAWDYVGNWAYLFLGLPIGAAAAPLVALFRKPRGSAAYLRLLLMVHNDSRTAERLIRTERARNPGLSRDECARRALEALEYERGR